MKIAELPFLHFFVRAGKGRESGLVSPMETDEVSGAGSFYAPLIDRGKMCPAYRFHFSIYLGDGTFVDDDRRQKVLFTGVATTASIERSDHLILVFGVPGPDPWWWFPHFRSPIPKLLQREGDFFVPMLRRVPRKRSLSYRGTMGHRDFLVPFVELEPADRTTLDDILMHFGISLIGCDPHTKYERQQLPSQKG